MSVMKNKFEYVIGIDQSYKRTGLSLSYKGEPIDYFSISPEASESISDARKEISNIIYQWLSKSASEGKLEPSKTICLFESIRMFSHGFLSMDYILKTGALITNISDIMESFGIICFSVDTRAWKAAVIGTSKPKDNLYKINPAKWPTICFVRDHLKIDHSKILIPEKKRKNGTIRIKGNYYSVNDDLCDAICISLYPFKENAKNMKKLEF